MNQGIKVYVTYTTDYKIKFKCFYLYWSNINLNAAIGSIVYGFYFAKMKDFS